MAETDRVKPQLKRTVSNNVGPDSNRFHRLDEAGHCLPRYDRSVKERNHIELTRKDSAITTTHQESEPLESSAIDVDVVDQGVNGDDRDAEKGESGTKSSCVARAWTFYKLGFVSLSLLIACFDLCADWFAVKDFHENEGGPLAIALTVFISISTLLFVMEAVNGVTSVRVYSCQHRDKKVQAKARKAVEVRREALSYGLLLLEDLPVTIIMYFTLQNAACPLYTRIFNESEIARYAMLAAFVSALWKALISFKYFIQCFCGEKIAKFLPNRRPSKHDDICDRLFCWACVYCRPVRIAMNVVVSSFAGYVFIRVWRNPPYDLRPECDLLANNVASAEQLMTDMNSSTTIPLL